VLCSHDVQSGVGSGVVSEIINMFNIPDKTPASDPDIKCSHDDFLLGFYLSASVVWSANKKV